MGPSLDLSRNGSSKEEQINDEVAGSHNAGTGSHSKMMSRSDLDPGGGGDRLSGRGASDKSSVDEKSVAAAGSSRPNVSVIVTAPPLPLSLPPPPDGGWGWMIVVGSILTVGLVPALFVCFGVFMNAFQIVFPNDSKSSASWIPSIMNALMNFMGPITSVLVNRYSARTVTFCGGIILSSGLLLSYFATSVKELYLTYGVLGGIGCGLSMSPGLFLISQYFKRRRGVATGLCMAGGSFCGIVFPMVVQNLLNEYNFHGCILVLGALTMNICVSAALFRPYDPRRSAAASRRVKRSRRRSSSTSTRSRRGSASASLAFLTEDAVVSSKRGSYSFVPDTGVEKKKKAKKKKRRSNKKKAKKTSRSRKDIGASVTDKNKDPVEVSLLFVSDQKSWQSIVVGQSDVKTRARTLSVDSTRITLPGIPEEREDDGTATNGVALTKPEIVHVNGECDVSDDHVPVNGTSTLLVANVASQRDSLTTTTEVVTLNHMFGSVASIVSLGADDDRDHGQSRRKTANIFDQIHRLLGFAFFSQGIFYVLSGSFTFMLITLGSYTMLIPTFGVSVNLSREKSAGLLSVIAIASMFGRLILPSLSDYVTLQRKHIYAMSSLVAACAVLSTIFIRDYTDLICSLVFFGFSSGGCLAISINVFLDYISVEKFTSFFGLIGVVVGTGCLFATPLMALLVDKTGSYDATFICLSLSSALSGSLLYCDRFTAARRTSTAKPTTTPV